MADSSSDESEDVGMGSDSHLPFVRAFSECKPLRGDTWLCFHLILILVFVVDGLLSQI